MNTIFVQDDWLSVKADVFWGKIAKFDHIVQFYENDGIYFDTVMGFVESAINSNETAVVIGCQEHLTALEKRIESYGYNVETLVSNNQFMPLDVDEIIGNFVVEGKVYESLLRETLATLFAKAGYNNKKYRVCGGIAGVLLASGHKEAAAKIEHLTNIIAAENPVCIFCAYSRVLFNSSIDDLFHFIYNKHSKIISGFEKQLTHVTYKQIASDYPCEKNLQN